MFPGLDDRLSKEVAKLAPEQRRVRTLAVPERKFSAWIGGSIMASLQMFQEIWISKEEYKECGAMIVNRKCF